MKVMNTLIKSIKVGCFDVAVEEYHPHVANARRLFGEYSPDELKIRVDFSQSTQKVLETMVHEITHAVYHIYNIDDKDEEERIVTSLARGWTQVYKENPAVLQFIQESVNVQG